MSAMDRRPVLVGKRGERVVLVIPRRGVGHESALAATLDGIERLGWVLAAVIDPANHLDALRMILDGTADVVVVTRSEDFPCVRMATSLGGSSGLRTEPIVRSAVGAAMGPRTQRPARITGSRPTGRPELLGPDEGLPGPEERRTYELMRPGSDKVRRPQIIERDSGEVVEPTKRRTERIRRVS